MRGIGTIANHSGGIWLSRKLAWKQLEYLFLRNVIKLLAFREKDFSSVFLILYEMIFSGLDMGWKEKKEKKCEILLFFFTKVSILFSVAGEWLINLR